MCLRDGQFVHARERDRFHGQSFWDFMKFLQERTRQESQRVVVICDNARYHHEKMDQAWSRWRRVSGVETLRNFPAWAVISAAWQAASHKMSAYPMKSRRVSGERNSALPAVNFLGEADEAQVRAAYPGPTWDRLRQIKAKYDPTNLLRLNQNIKP
jgi:FAD/FMN-containing dehydrogenase